MADMQNLVERLERVVGRLEAVSHASDMHCGYGDRDTKGKQYALKTQCLGLKFFSQCILSFEATFPKHLI